MTTTTLHPPTAAVKPDRVCQRQGCSASLEGKRSTAKFCSRRCKEAARHAANPERRREGTRRWLAANREANRAPAREARRRWSTANPDAVHASAALGRATKRGAYTEKFTRAAVYVRDRGVCGITGEKVDPENHHVDHIVPLAMGGSHTLANVQVSTPAANSAKRDRLQPEHELLILDELAGNPWGFTVEDILPEAFLNPDWDRWGPDHLYVDVRAEADIWLWQATRDSNNEEPNERSMPPELMPA